MSFSFPLAAHLDLPAGEVVLGAQPGVGLAGQQRQRQPEAELADVGRVRRGRLRDDAGQQRAERRQEDEEGGGESMVGWTFFFPKD